MTETNRLQPLRWRELVWLFGLPTLMNSLACQVAIPHLDALHALPIEVTYFFSVGVLVLLPMLLWALYLTSREIGSRSPSKILARMRIVRMSRQDWVWAVASFLGLSLMSYLIARILMPMMGMDATPFFFKNMPVDAEHVWIVAVWPVFFFLNIAGEECLWRGYILPRQELLTGQWTWLVHGCCWAFWHIPMGIDLIIAATPIFFILPAVVQLRKNTTIALVVHAVFGAFGFLALAFGGVQ